MAPPKPIYATIVFVFGCFCLVLGCIALFLPIWGHFEDRHGGYQSERGYFGPWKVCKKLNYGREICGDRFRFQVSGLSHYLINWFLCKNENTRFFERPVYKRYQSIGLHTSITLNWCNSHPSTGLNQSLI